MGLKKLILPALLMVTACGQQTQDTLTMEPPTPQNTTVHANAPVLDLTQPAIVNKPAVRLGPQIQITPTTVPPSPQDIVNNLPYGYGKAEPAQEAFRIVAVTRGWDPVWAEAWVPFVTKVMSGESAFCWNLRRGATLADPSNCTIGVQGRYSDAGFGQLISIHHGPGRWLCVEEGICGADGVVSSPWNSMTALVALVERSGNGAWCYVHNGQRSTHLRSGTCNLAP